MEKGDECFRFNRILMRDPANLPVKPYLDPARAAFFVPHYIKNNPGANRYAFCQKQTFGQLNRWGFSCEITELRKVPLTAVVSRELWVLLPWDMWQYFLIGDDRIMEIHNDNWKVTGTQENAAVVQDQRDPVPALTGLFFRITG